ncbi:hypothetical protein DPMN_074918 [Dreissena polymorpha]|uniref:Uncharacterized protein n=1 Tax=Dreissena polymorpha TaxID=45954 RepID=A0A9D3YK51_DREPO|nr:hypothetical protein DPMN_074918 [Dreissena polymorpha]
MRTCRFCDKRHYSSICSKNAVFKCYSTSRPEAAILYADAGNARTEVLLKTAVAEVGYAQYTASADILLDEEVQRSFVTEKLANEINLTRTGTDTIQVASFGKRSNEVRHMDTAEIYH